MEEQALKVIAQVAGIGGIAIAGTVMVFRDVIRRNIFPKLSPDHAYQLIRLIVILAFLVSVLGVGAWIWTQREKEIVIANSTPEALDIHTARECLRPSAGKFTNYCGFPIAFTYCFQINGSDPEAWKEWRHSRNSCNFGSHRTSEPILPNGVFVYPMAELPESPDGKWTAGLKFLSAVKFPQ